MLQFSGLLRPLALGVAAASLIGSTASAESAAEFYKDKVVTVYAGASAGGGYDLYARLVGNYLGKYIPGKPTVIVSNMPGGGGIRMTNYLYNKAPRDGTRIGIIPNGASIEQVTGNTKIHFDVRKFGWIGRLGTMLSVNYTWHTSKVKTIEDAKRIPVFMGATGPLSMSVAWPTMLNRLVGTKFKLITGFKGMKKANLAMVRGEVDGAMQSWVGLNSRYSRWLTEKKVNILVQFALKRHPALPNVPAIVELATNEDDRAVFEMYARGAVIGRSYTTTPGVPADRLAALRSAFMTMVRDPAYLAEMKKRNVPVEPLSGEEVSKLMGETFNLSPALIEQAKRARRYKKTKS